MAVGDGGVAERPEKDFHENMRSLPKDLLSSPTFSTTDSEILNSDYLFLPSEPQDIQKWISTEECDDCFRDSIFERDDDLENLLRVLNEQRKHATESLLNRRVSTYDTERNSNVATPALDNDKDDNSIHLHSEDEDTQLEEVAEMPFSLANVLSRIKSDEQEKLIGAFVSTKNRLMHSSMLGTKQANKENKCKVLIENNEKPIDNEVSDSNNTADNTCARRSDRVFPIRKPFLEITNVSPLKSFEEAGKWKCPRKRDTDCRPSMKQLGLEKWVRRVEAKIMRDT